MTGIKVGTLLKYYGFDSSEETVGLVVDIDDCSQWVWVQWADEDEPVSCGPDAVKDAFKREAWEIVG